MDYETEENATRTNAEQSETAADFRVSYESRDTLYFMRAGDFVKIGRSIHLDRRLAAIQCACPFDVTLAASFVGLGNLEGRTHTRLEKHHVRGEWFRWHPDVELQIAKLAKARPRKPKAPDPSRGDWRIGSPLYA